MGILNGMAAELPGMQYPPTTFRPTDIYGDLREETAKFKRKRLTGNV